MLERENAPFSGVLFFVFCCRFGEKLAVLPTAARMVPGRVWLYLYVRANVCVKDVRAYLAHAGER